MPAQAYRVPHPSASMSSNSGGHPGGQMRPPSRPVSTVPSMNNEENSNSVVPGGTNVISGYDPATVRAMNLSRAENLLSQKQQKYYPKKTIKSTTFLYAG